MEMKKGSAQAMIRKLIVFCIPAALLISCAASKFGRKAESGPSKNESQVSPYVEDFDPNTLNDDDINPAMDKALIQSAKPPQSQKNVPIREKAASETVVNGYRIQLLATKDENQANDMKKQAILKFQDVVYLVFEAPYYRIRVGDCISEKDAKTLRDEAVRRGFPDAWIVPSKVINRGNSSTSP
jgi:hypothetical protein